jgi:Mrp family chromosome partitioning ATPase
MARMLQALKNLEARSSRPAAEAPARPPAPPATPDQTAAESLEQASDLLESIATTPPIAAPPPAEPAIREALPVLLQAQSVVAQSPNAYDDAAASVFVNEQLLAPPRVPAPPPSARRNARRDTFGSARPPTSLERSVRRTLSDPSRSQPLTQLAHRLARDLEQTGSKTVLWIGIGESKGGHETLLHAAALLAAEQPGRTLLIDADLARRPLSEGLEYGQEPGLAELLKSDDAPKSRCRPTAFEKLSLLPSGLLRHIDLSAAGPRLEDVLKQLAAEFSLVLIDGGRSADLAASALARLSDATYFVVQLGAVEACEAQAALRDFRAAGARVLGCVAT